MTARRHLVALLAGTAMLAGFAAPATVHAPAAAAAVDVPLLPTGSDGLARAIVAFEGGTVPRDVLASLDALGVVRGLELASIGAVAVTAPQAVVETLALDSRVLAVEPQRALALDLYASREQIGANGVDEPDDYRATVAGAAVDTTRPGVTGEGVTVAVLDSGIFAPHPDFGDRVTLGLHFAFSEIQDSGGISYEEWDAYAESTGTIALQDEIGHGTHVASTVGGSGAAAEGRERDLAGVAPGVEFVSMKVADAPFGIVDDIDWEEAALAAFDYIIRHPELGIRIAQNSWGLLPHEPDCLGAGCGEPTDFDAMAEMIGAVEDAGVSVVFSAGNAGPEPDTIGHYHRPGQAILVGAACKSVDSGCEPDEEITAFSSRGPADGTGPQVHVVAPGDQIMAAVSPSVLLPLTSCPDQAAEYPEYYCLSGTSMASPHVSGVASLMYEANPDLTPVQVRSCLTSTADDMVTPGVDIHSGHGMVDTPAALRCAHELTLSLQAQAPMPAGVSRLSGDDRIDTAVAVSRFSRPADDSAGAVVLARADDFADGLAGTPLAVALGGPLLLTAQDGLDPATLAEIDRVLPDGGRVVLLGGRVALSEDVRDQVAAAGYSPERIAGPARYETAVAVAERLDRIAPLETVLVARGDLFPDALAAGPAAVASDGAILLSDVDRAHPATDAFLAGHEGVDVVAVGGQAAAAYPDAAPVVGDTRDHTAVAVAQRFLPEAEGVGIVRRDDFADALTGGVQAAGVGAPILLTAHDALPAPTAAWLDAQSQLTSIVVYGGELAVSAAVQADLEQRLP